MSCVARSIVARMDSSSRPASRMTMTSYGRKADHHLPVDPGLGLGAPGGPEQGLVVAGMVPDTGDPPPIARRRADRSRSRSPCGGPERGGPADRPRVLRAAAAPAAARGQACRTGVTAVEGRIGGRAEGRPLSL